ncbi:lipase/acyltransferase domain-containing protein [Bacillus tropicus]|uniref:lipase/acyltransferase domain-containing protein n=1 Tax=Bacillus tropicus TaxID=2026188 RepID=UPI0035D909D2
MSVCIFVPGIKGTELYEGENKRWFPSTKKDLASLVPNNELEARKVLGAIRAFFVKKEGLYQGVIDRFGADENFIPYPYDWRMSILDIVDNFVEFILSTAAEKENDIILVAHSMGGILSKLAILKIYEMGHIDIIKKLVTIGTPWKGSPDSYKVLEYGEPGFYSSLREFLSMFDDKDTRSLARKLPSVYQLLPSEEYFNSTYGKFIVSADKDHLTYEDIKGKVQAIYNKEHKKAEDDLVIDVWEKYINPVHQAMLQDLPVEHDCLIGIDQPTFYTYPEKSFNKLRLYKANAVIKNGDTVVPFYSALPHHDANIYYVDSVHRNQCSHPGVVEFIEWIWNGKVGNQPISVGKLEEHQQEERALIENAELKNGILACILCPVETTILDKENKYVAGVIDPSLSNYSSLIDSEEVQYLQVGDAKYLYINKNEEFDFEINAYKEGIAEIAVEVFDEENTEIQFNTLPISPNSNARLVINNEAGTGEQVKVELKHNNESLAPKVKKRHAIQEFSALPIPTLELKVTKKEETKKTPHVHVYSGPVKLEVSTIGDVPVEELLYAINGKSITRIKENNVDIDLPSGIYKIEVFAKDMYGRALRSKEVKIKIDKDVPETVLMLKITPDYSIVDFNVNTVGSKFKTYYRFIDSDRVNECSLNEEWKCKENSKEEIFIPYDIIRELSQNRNKKYMIQYYSESEFGLKEAVKYFEFAIRDLVSTMWSEVTSVVTAKYIFKNITGDTKSISDDVQVEQKVQNKFVSLNPEAKIADNVKSVQFTSKDYQIEVFFSEKYALYFSGPPTELLEIGQDYTFSFELITERSKERVFGTEPRAKLKPIQRGGHGKVQKIELKQKNGVYYGSFTVNELFKLYKHKLIIEDIKNVSPPLRESTLMLREEGE